MRIERSERGDLTILSLSGQFDRTEDENFRAHVTTLLDSGAGKIIVDLSGATMVTSTGFGALLTSYRRFREARGDLVLVGLRDIVAKAFSLLELEGKIPVFSTREEAEAYLATLGTPPKPLEREVPVILVDEEDEEFEGVLESVSERELELTIPSGVGPLLARDQKLRASFEIAGAGPVAHAHILIVSVVPHGEAKQVHASFDLLPREGRESIRAFLA